MTNYHSIGFLPVDFEVPLNFPQFMARYPDYVRRWLRKKLRWKKGMDVDSGVFRDMEDLEQDLLLFLSTLPKDSKYRRLGYNDPIELYKEEYFGKQTHADARVPFSGYLNRILTNKLITLTRNLECDALHKKYDGYRGSLHRAGAYEPNLDDKILVSQLLQTAQTHYPDLLCYLNFEHGSSRAKNKEAKADIFFARRKMLIDRLQAWANDGTIKKARKPYVRKAEAKRSAGAPQYFVVRKGNEVARIPSTDVLAAVKRLGWAVEAVIQH